jgi:hypothetical protein
MEYLRINLRYNNHKNKMHKQMVLSVIYKLCSIKKCGYMYYVNIINDHIYGYLTNRIRSMA